MFPKAYQDFIEQYLSSQSIKVLSQSFHKLSTGYRSLKAESLGSKKEDVDAYLMGRLPLTFAVLESLFQQISSLFSEKVTIIDYGSGPGTALLALHSAWPDKIIDYIGVEEKQPMIDAASYLAKCLGMNADFIKSHVVKAPEKKANLAVISYLLNELDDSEGFLNKILHEHQSILIIEPGTPDGTERILKMRALAISSGFHVVYPCPHQMSCPMPKGKWCHFYKRVERTRALRQIKQAQLGYEDEKYMYLFLSKEFVGAQQGVIVDTPKVFPHKIEMNVCSAQGQFEKVDILKKDKEMFKKGKKLSWGDFI
jgi:ribosomal protein RSM22 (predicted rRNA methylase)